MFDPTPYRKLFPICRELAFFNHAGVSPLSTPVREAMACLLDRMTVESMVDVLPEIKQTTTRLRERLVRLINAAGVDEIVLMPNTAAGINSVAVSLPLRPGDNVLVLDGDYPANVYPWMNLAQRGVLTKLVPQRDGGLDLDVLRSRIDSRTRVIALSSVMFATGFRNDLVTVGQICRERGIYFVVDAIQSLGAFPIDVQQAGIDFLAAGSQKWLLGPVGTGFLYVRRERIGELLPGSYVGASSVVDELNYLDYNLTLKPGAARFMLGSENFAGQVGLEASVALIEEVGVPTIAGHVERLVDTAINDLGERGYRFAASTDPAHRSGILVVEVPDAPAASARLRGAGVVAIPRGCGIRIAPHFYNTEAEILRVGEVLGDR